MPSTVSSSTSVSDGGHSKEFTASVLVIVSMGLTSLLVMRLPLLLAGYASIALAIFGYMWMRLHGMKLTRREIVYFDEKCLLQAKEDANYSMVPLDPKEAGLLYNLVRNEEHSRLQSFYAEHYGQVWKTGRQREKILAEQRRSEVLQQDEVEQDQIEMDCVKVAENAFEDESAFSTASEITVE